MAGTAVFRASEPACRIAAPKRSVRSFTAWLSGLFAGKPAPRSALQPRSRGKDIDPEQFLSLKIKVKQPCPLLAAMRIKDNFPLTHTPNSLKTTPNNIDYHLDRKIFVTFLTKHN